MKMDINFPIAYLRNSKNSVLRTYLEDAVYRHSVKFPSNRNNGTANLLFINCYFIEI